jgi:hypothetical protein
MKYVIKVRESENRQCDEFTFNNIERVSFDGGFVMLLDREGYVIFATSSHSLVSLKKCNNR